MIKENELTFQKNRINSFRLPKISSKFPKTTRNLKNDLTNNHKAIKLKSKLIGASKNIANFNTIKNDIDLVKNLDINLKIDQIMSRETDFQRLKDKIDNNPDIILKRLGTYKSKQSREENINDIESKERVKFLEKEFNNNLKEYSIIKNENEKLNEHIKNILNIIEDYKLESYALDSYRKEFFKQFLINEEQKKSEILEKLEKNLYRDKEEFDSLQKELRQYQIDKNAKFQKEMTMRKENIEENLSATKELLVELQHQKNNLKLESQEIKSKINENKNQLIKLYHISLYEGLDFRYEGLSNVIRAIWSMGEDVDIKYMPSYLDKLLISFLFEHAKQYMEMINLRQQIDISHEKFLKELNDWKNINDYNFRSIENSSLSSNSDVNLFQTKLNSNKGKYPKSRKFMKNYYNKYSHLIDNKEINELNEYKKSMSNKTISLPTKFVEENKKIEKGKYILQNLQTKMKELERKEIRRICREFVINNYEKIYQVCPYIIVSAICGDENKDEGMMFYNRVEKEIFEGKKVIRFFEPRKHKIDK